MADEPKSKESNTKYVRYIGTADVRVISKSDWGNADVKDQNLTRWSVRNGWKIPQSELSDSALEYLSNDSGFVVDAD